MLVKLEQLAVELKTIPTLCAQLEGSEEALYARQVMRHIEWILRGSVDSEDGPDHSAGWRLFDA